MTLPTPPKLYTCANCGARCDYYLQWVDMDHAPGQRWCDDCLATVKSRAPAAKSPQPPKKDRVQ